MSDKIAIPTAPIDAAAAKTLEGVKEVASGSGLDLSILGMFSEADFLVKLVIILLVLASLWSWTIIFDKLQRLYAIRKRMDRFEDAVWSEPLEQRFNRAKDNPDHPMARVFVAGMYEWLDMKKRGLIAGARAGLPRHGGGLPLERVKERVLACMDSIRNREMAALEKHVSFLATVGSTAPFVGLFGTVWGIMNSFQNIAMTKNTTLAVVAPCIAEALFATAVGLFAAIPAVVFYNKLSTSLSEVADRIDDFSDEFVTTVTRELEDQEIVVQKAA